MSRICFPPDIVIIESGNGARVDTRHTRGSFGELSTNFREVSQCPEKDPNKASSLLKVPSSITLNSRLNTVSLKVLLTIVISRRSIDSSRF